MLRVWLLAALLVDMRMIVSLTVPRSSFSRDIHEGTGAGGCEG